MKSDKVFDPRKIKKEISKELVSYFPELKTYTDVKLYKVLGCFIVGFEVQPPRDGGYDEYSSTMVRFHINSLWTEPLDVSDYIHYLYVPGHLWGPQAFIKPKTYKEDCASAVEGFKKKINFPLEGDIKLVELFEICDKRLLDSHNYISNGKLLAIKLYASIYVNSKYHIDLILNDIKEKESKVWCKDKFYRPDHFASWYPKLEYYAYNREDFMSILERNKSNPKLKRLIRSEIIL